MGIASPVEHLTNVDSGGSTLDELRGKLAELIEVTAEELDVDEPLIHLGADSLILMEAISFVEQRFRVQLRASQIIEDLDTLERVAAFIDGGDRTEPEPPVTEVAEVAEVAEVTEVAEATQSVAAGVDPEHARSPRQAETFVSWMPSTDGLRASDLCDPTPALVQEFGDRLAGSKLHADRYRPTHADPRSVASFRPAIKETVVPLIAGRARGSKLWDIDGNEYLDMAMGFGSLLFGHAHPPIQQAIERQVAAGVGVGPVSFYAGPLSEEICQVTGQERASFTVTGTEAVMLAMRLARAATGRRKIALFRGAYHGWWDGVLSVPGAERGSAAPAVAGTIGHPEADLLLLPWGEDSSLDVLEAHGSSVAAVLVEPVQSRRPDCQPIDLLRGLRSFADRHGAVLAYDEMISGFRLAPGGAAEAFGIAPDLVTFGKSLGGGLPLGCIAGRADLLDVLDGGQWRYGDDSTPQTPVTFGAGTFAKHPLAMAAAWGVMQEIRRLGDELYEHLEARSERLQSEVNDLLHSRGIDAELARAGSLMRFMSRQNLDAFFAGLILNGCYMWEGRTMFVSWAHDDADVDRFVHACDMAIDGLGEGRGAKSPSSSPASSQSPGPARVRELGEPLEELPLTPNQRQLVFAYRSGSEAAEGFHNVAVVTFEGPLDVDALEKAIDAMVERHDGMRSTFDVEREVEIVHANSAVGLDVFPVDHLSGQAQRQEVERLVDLACTEPFDLVDGPMWKFHLVVESATRAEMVVASSDLVADGWSMSLVLSEITALYDAVVTGSTPALEPAGRLATLRSWLESGGRREEVDTAASYWEAVLRDADLGPALPPIREGNSTSYIKTRAKRVVDASTLGRIKDLGRSLGVTQFSLYLGAFAALIHRVGARDDFVVGIPTAGRPLEELRGIVASCTTPVAIRLQVGPDLTGRDLLQLVQRQVFEAVDQAIPVDLLARRRAQASGRLGPITPVMFNLDPVRDVPPLVDGVRISIGSPERTYGLNPFSVQVCTRNDGTMSLSFDAAASMYDPAMVAAWADYYLSIVRQILADPDAKVASLSLEAAP